MAALAITGYEPDCNCEHCGRKLRHGIRVSTGQVVGATCFNKVLTKPRTYQGKKYRVGEENVIRYAKIAEKGTAKRHGMTTTDFIFEAAE
jgi:hypothetical protein